MNDKNIDSGRAAERIRKLRELNGYSRNEAAKLLHISPEHLRHIESGKGYSADLLERMSELYHVSMDFISKGVSSPDATDMERKAAIAMAVADVEEAQRNLAMAAARLKALLKS